MEDGTITNMQLSSKNNDVDKARLNNDGNYWDSGSDETPYWIQADLLQIKIVTQIGTRVLEVDNDYSIKFNVYCSILNDNPLMPIRNEDNSYVSNYRL